MATVDHGLIKTAAAEQVVAPIACQLCYLVLLCENAEETEQFTQLEGVAQAVAKATKNMAAIAARQMDESKDEVMQFEMSSLLEAVMVSGQHVLLAAQKLNIQPGLAEHREELISAAQNVMLGVVKVLIVDDDATVGTILAAADQVLQCLYVLGASLDITSLLRSFQRFADTLLLLNHLTVERANSLQDPTQTKQLLDSLKTLRKCVSMLHTAMCTTIKHPVSEQAQEAKRYILDKVESTVKDIIGTLRSECHRGSLGHCGFYTEGRNCLLQLLANPATCSMREAGLDSLVRDLVLHCMVVANSSRRELQQKVVSHCRHVLQFWSDITRILKFSENPDSSKRSLEDFCTSLMNQVQTLDQVLMTSVLYQVLDAFLSASLTFEELVHVTAQVLNVESVTELDLEYAHPLLEDFICQTDRIINVANFISAVAADAKSLENVENSRTCLLRLRAGIASLSLELTDNTLQTVQKLHEVCQRWEEETSQLQEALSDIMDVREFTSIGIHEMVNDRHGCDEAYKEQSCRLFKEHANYFICHMKQVIHSVKRHLDRSDNPIYRNGLLVLLKQAQTSQIKVVRSVTDMLAGSRLNVDIYSTFSDAVSTAIQQFKVLREGLDGHQHPHILSPLRKDARRSLVCDLPLSVKEMDELHLDHKVSSEDFPTVEVFEREFGREHETEDTEGEIVEASLAHKYDMGDLQMPAVCEEQNPIHKPVDLDILPLLYEVVTVTKGKDVTRLNQACTSVLELSNCYAQAAKEASSAVDVVNCQTLDSCRAELVSLTPLLVQTAQETAMSSGMSTDSIYKHSVMFSDLINNIRKILLPVAGPWFYAITNMLHDHQPNMAAIIAKQLSEVMSLCADVVQLLTSSDITTHSDGHESFNVLHNKLNKAQNSTRHLTELCSSLEGLSVVDQFDGPCILWALSIQILLNSLDAILGTTAMKQYGQKRLSALSENSLRIQEAARLTSLNYKSAYKAKQLTESKDELKKLTETYLRVAEDLIIMPNVLQLAKSEFLERNLLIKIRVLSAHLSKANKDYASAIQNIINIASLAAKHTQAENIENVAQQLENAAQILFENVKASAKSVEDCLNYIRDPHARSNLRSINDHLSFQISDIVSRARLMVETHSLCDTLSLEVQAQCWSAKARYVAEEINKLEGIHQEVKEQIKTGLQGTAPANMEEVLTVPSTVKKVEIPPAPPLMSYQKSHMENTKAAETNTCISLSTMPRYESALEKHGGAMFAASKEASSLAYTSLFLKQESDSWDPRDNRIVQVTRSMADKIYYMTQYLRRKGPILNKEAFVNTAREVISNCESITQFVRVIASHCLDKQCTVELSLIVEQIVTITNQLNIISSVNAVTPGCKSSDEILVKNAQNLLQTVLQGVRAAETACITGLKQPEPNSDGAEAAALCFQWKKNLQIHRAQQISNQETDDLGLRKTSPNQLAPSLAPPIEVQDSKR